MKKRYTTLVLLISLSILNIPLLFSQQTVIEDFEESATVPGWINANQSAPQPSIVENPDKSGLNPSDSCMLWIKNKDSKVFAAAMSGLEAYNIQFNGEATFVHLKMMKDNTDPCAFQVIRTEDGETEADKLFNPPPRIPCPTPNEWVDYVFDFSAPEATSQTWTRIYFMPVMNATEEGGWTEDPLESDVDVYIDDIIVDSESDPYTSAATTVFMDRAGNVSYILNNPVTSELILEGIGKVRNITLYNLSGQQIKSIPTYSVTNYVVPVADLSKGIYIVKFQKDDGTVSTSKIIKR